MMHTTADKAKDNNNPAHDTRSGFFISESQTQFADNRPEFIAQRKFIEMGNNSPRATQLKTLQAMTRNQGSSVIQREIANAHYKGQLATSIEEYAGKLNLAVQNAWGLIIKTPTLGSFANLNGYTQLWVTKIKSYGEKGVDPGGLHTAFGYAVESLVSGPLLPSAGGGIKIIQQGARGSTRPDLILQLNNVDIAWLDITASSSAGHIFSKTGGWDQSPSYAEITYPSIGTSDLIEMATSARDNPNAEIGGTVDPQEYVERQKRAQKELQEKLSQWKSKLVDALAPVLKIGGPWVPDDAPPRRAKTVELMQIIFGEKIAEAQAAHILQAVKMSPSSYGFRTGFLANSATGVAYLLDKNP